MDRTINPKRVKTSGSSRPRHNKQHPPRGGEGSARHVAPEPKLRVGRSQLSIIEHAWFPLDQKLRGRGFVHKTAYPIYRPATAPIMAEVEVECPRGLKPYDEYLLHGLLGLALAEPSPTNVYYATTNYIFTWLGLDNGGRGYRELDEAMTRLESVTYRCKNFYHPIQGDIAKYISFGFAKRCIPLVNETERGWKFVFDEQLFEFVRHANGGIKFPFHLYAPFDAAARRLFLPLRKVFHRRSTTHSFDLDYLSDVILGYRPEFEPREKKRKVIAAAQQLLDAGVILLAPESSSLKDEFKKIGKGKYAIAFRRGPNGKGEPAGSDYRQSSLYEMLTSLDIHEHAIREVIETCPTNLTQEWIQITLAAKDRSLIRTTPAAYFLDNIRHAKTASRRPPDWWRELQKQEDERAWREGGAVLRSHIEEQAEANGMTVPTFQEYLRSEKAKNEYESTIDRLFSMFAADPKLSERQRDENVQWHAEQHMRNRYRHEYPNADVGSAPSRASDVFHS